MILMLFGVFLAVTVSRYYAATWAMVFARGAAGISLRRPATRAGSAQRGSRRRRPYARLGRPLLRQGCGLPGGGKDLLRRGGGLC